MNKANFFLVFFALILSFEFLNIMAFVVSKQLFVNNLELNDFKIFLLEAVIFGFISYYSVKKKK
ncbi:MAG: hypothetical protein WC376_04355 [Candidatus Nanoarchaeia archaeon]|jgi:predicted membrane protein